MNVEKHIKIYAENGIYAGWPANHGAWQWGPEMLVGFLRGPYKRNSMHNITEPHELMQARSLDGGETWDLEETEIPTNYTATKPAPPFRLEDGAIIRIRGTYDHGGDDIPEEGGFWLSLDRGRTWSGGFGFDWAKPVLAHDEHLTSRTNSVGSLFFMSKATKQMWGTDQTFCARYADGKFSFVADVCNDRGRAVMPAAAKVGDRLVCTMRRRITNRFGGWIDAYGSDDDGKTWRFLAEVGVTGSRNGNPPALIADGERLVCCYGNRDARAVLARESLDGGKTWSLPLVLRGEGVSDIGYPQLLRRPDGKLLCAYYWADKITPQQHIAGTVFC